MSFYGGEIPWVGLECIAITDNQAKEDITPSRILSNEQLVGESFFEYYPDELINPYAFICHLVNKYKNCYKEIVSMVEYGRTLEYIGRHLSVYLKNGFLLFSQDFCDFINCREMAKLRCNEILYTVESEYKD